MNSLGGCKQTRRLIDEADRSDSLSLEAASHVSTCADCRTFADERDRLRHLLASVPRVNAPLGFDAALNRRIAESNARTRFAWLSPPGYLRLGAAAASIVVLVLVVQYVRVFESEKGTNSTLENAGTNQSVGQAPKEPAPAVVVSSVPRDSEKPAANRIEPARSYARRSIATGTRAVSGEKDYLLQEGTVLVRGPNGDHEVRLPMVSVGAQPIVFVSAGIERPAPRTLGTSF